jgi:hypothetical protein
LTIVDRLSVGATVLTDRYDIRHVLSPVSADIQLIFPSLRNAFHCFNATNHPVPCACNETFIDFVVYMVSPSSPSRLSLSLSVSPAL